MDKILTNCKDCAKYKGDCGKHPKDVHGHILYDTPLHLSNNKCPGFQYPQMEISIPEAIEEIERIMAGNPSREEFLPALQMAKNSLEAWHNVKGRLYAETKKEYSQDTFFTEVWTKATNNALNIVSYELHKLEIKEGKENENE